MGGTTSAIALIRDGLPVMAAAGAAVGGWRTGIASIDIETVGLGGDSPVSYTHLDLYKRQAQYCPEFMENIDPLEKLNNTAPDGHIYTLKTHYNNDANWADPRNLPSPGDPGLYYRADIMEKLSLPMFNSVETFDETLYAVQAKANDCLLYTSRCV